MIEPQEQSDSRAAPEGERRGDDSSRAASQPAPGDVGEAELDTLAAELRGAFGPSGPAGRGADARFDEQQRVSSAAPKPGDRLDDFELLTELGRGGMGVVYRAKQISLNRLVALKLLSADALDSPERLLRFRNECRAVAKLSHPAIVPIYAQGQVGSLLYYAMELVEGESLDHLIARGAVTAREPGNDRLWAGRFAEVARALHHAHGEKVYHRDIKPANLILDHQGKLHILDFGVARIVDVPGLTITGQVLGTPAYLAPEQVGAGVGRRKDEQAGLTRFSSTEEGVSAGDHRSDIYAVGVALYETLTGRTPFQGRGLAEVLRLIAEEEPTPPRRLNAAIGKDIEAIILQAMRKDPQRRYQSAAELASDLEAAAGGAPVRARRPALAERLWRWVRAHQALAAMGAFGLALSVILLLTSQYLILALLLALFALVAVQINLARRREIRRLVDESLRHLLRESYHDLATVRPMLARAQRLGCRSADLRIAAAMTELAQSPSEAARKLERLVARDPSQRLALYLLAWAGRLQGDPARCRDWLARAEEAGGPACAEEHFLCGIAILPWEAERAIACFRSAIALKPDFTQALLHLGRALNQWLYSNRELDHFAEQTTCLESLCLLRPTSAYPRYLLSLAYRLAAEVHVERARAIEPGASRALHEEQSRSLFAKAYEAAKQAQRIEPTNGRGYAAEAEYFEKTGDYYAAITAWDNAFRYERSRQTRVEVHQYRFRLEWWTCQLDRALWDLESLQLLVPDDPFFTVLYPVLVLAESRQSTEARRRLESAHGSDRDLTARVVDIAVRLVGLDHPGDTSFDRERQDLSAERDEGGEPAHLYFTGVERLLRDDRQGALVGLDAAVRCYDNEEFSFHALALARKLRLAPGWPGEVRIRSGGV